MRNLNIVLRARAGRAKEGNEENVNARKAVSKPASGLNEAQSNFSYNDIVSCMTLSLISVSVDAI